ncbi:MULTISPECIES: hypothetical protein [Burkholderia]|uniref:hypothetical protein n=1 Tax=Burkholderia TaxID=32008 RepID=UPI000A4EFE98|nr:MULTISPECIES: hypothetical protein [Burkholderia]MCW3689777.1 hypothetical protein [Burkholderia cenocepacia]MCW5182234.1 hypothetical protein [Burkholderia cenocepacia]MCW5187472.1 hypothetical protein [Burkholderia cenocepacia]MDN7680760.1 hypothetical protein [Burkholderia cenocepacia]MEB2601725.1 hypothetical protein [Burkholderia cenocepacia]
MARIAPLLPDGRNGVVPTHGGRPGHRWRPVAGRPERAAASGAYATASARRATYFLREKLTWINSSTPPSATGAGNGATQVEIAKSEAGPCEHADAGPVAVDRARSGFARPRPPR